MATILGLDASTEVCSVALLHDEKIHEFESDKPKAHAEVLLPMVDDILGSQNIVLNDVDIVAVTAGPGSFTGLRIAFSVAQGLAYAADKEMRTCSSLQVLVHGFSAASVSQQWVLCILDARMAEFYWSVYQKTGASWQAIVPDQLSSMDELIAKVSALPLNTEKCLVTGSGAEEFTARMSSTNYALVGSYPKASALVALTPGTSGVWQGPAGQASLNYLRDSVTWQKRTRIRQ